MGLSVGEVCRKMGVSEATFYNWKKKYGGLGVSELRELRQLKEENIQLKRLVADLSLDKQILKDVIKKSSKANSEAFMRDLYSAELPSVDQAGMCLNFIISFGMVL